MSDAPGAVMRGAVDLSSLRNRPAPGAAPAPTAGPSADGAAPLAVPMIQDVTEASFQGVLELSARVPVVADLYMGDGSAALTETLERLIAEQGGRLVLAKIDVAENRQIAQAFGVQAVPAIIALVGGRPVPLFNGSAADDDIRAILAQLLQLAEQNGVTGTVAADAAPQPPAPKPIPPLHAEAYAAIESGDYERAVRAYEQALNENPRDDEARAGLGQVRLLARVQGADLQAARDAAAQAPLSVDAQLAVADLDVAGGHVDDAFGRLLELFQALPQDERGAVQERLVELFGLVGDADPRVIRARQRFASLLF